MDNKREVQCLNNVEAGQLIKNLFFDQGIELKNGDSFILGKVQYKIENMKYSQDLNKLTFTVDTVKIC